jgi:hypothetical protein
MNGPLLHPPLAHLLKTFSAGELHYSAQPVSRTFWKMTGPWKVPRGSLATPIAGPQSFMIAAGKRFSLRTWTGFGIDRIRVTIPEENHTHARKMVYGRYGRDW